MSEFGGPPGAAQGLVAARRTLGRGAGVMILLAGMGGLITMHLLSGRPVSVWSDVLVAVALVAGAACLRAPWERMSVAWLHVLPVVATVDIAVSIRVAGTYGNIAADYYIFVAVFAAYAFSSRRAVAAHVAVASVASALPLLYATPVSDHTPARVAIGVLMLSVVAGVITVLREGLEARQGRLEQLAILDPLTEVGNYRLLTERLDYEVARHRRSGSCLSVVLLDLDGFKEINDTLGHLVGDRALVEVARALSGAVRRQDTVSRQGGDEFSILAPETDAEQAQKLAQRAREAISAASEGWLTASVGVATFPTDARDPDRLLGLADADLRRSKVPGRRLRHRAEKPERESAARV